MLTIKAHFDGQVIIPAEPLSLPPGEMEITIARPTDQRASQGTLAALAAIADKFPDDPDMPEDFAEQHDHYLYGTPKRP
jgi:hypothetical protein